MCWTGTKKRRGGAQIPQARASLVKRAHRRHLNVPGRHYNILNGHKKVPSRSPNSSGEGQFGQTGMSRELNSSERGHKRHHRHPLSAKWPQGWINDRPNGRNNDGQRGALSIGCVISFGILWSWSMVKSGLTSWGAKWLNRWSEFWYFGSLGWTLTVSICDENH